MTRQTRTGELGAEQVLCSLQAWLYQRAWLLSSLGFTAVETRTAWGRHRARGRFLFGCFGGPYWRVSFWQLLGKGKGRVFVLGVAVAAVLADFAVIMLDMD
jgi:hypothetical protein